MQHLHMFPKPSSLIQEDKQQPHLSRYMKMRLRMHPQSIIPLLCWYLKALEDSEQGIEDLEGAILFLVVLGTEQGPGNVRQTLGY